MAPIPRPQPVPPMPAGPEPIRRVESWYAEPAQVFDNVYWVGTKINSAWAIKTSAGIILLDTMYNYAAETEIVDGLKKLGLDPATIKYVIVSHGHGDHDEGAKLLQDKYGARVIMGGARLGRDHQGEQHAGRRAQARHRRDRRPEGDPGR